MGPRFAVAFTTSASPTRTTATASGFNDGTRLVPKITLPLPARRNDRSVYEWSSGYDSNTTTRVPFTWTRTFSGSPSSPACSAVVWFVVVNTQRVHRLNPTNPTFPIVKLYQLVTPRMGSNPHETTTTTATSKQPPTCPLPKAGSNQTQQCLDGNDSWERANCRWLECVCLSLPSSPWW
jgi:hypothetical protein